MYKKEEITNEQIVNSINKIIEELKEQPWAKELDEGFFSIEEMYRDISNRFSIRNINDLVLKDFYKKDEEIMKEIKEFILKKIKTLMLNSFISNKNDWEIEEK